MKPESTASKPSRKPAAKPSKERGNMKRGEITPLAIAARKAFDFQVEMGIIPATADFDEWRRVQCMTAVGKPGISACNHEHFRPLLGHFQVLCGDDSSAFENLITGGKPTDNAAPGDDHEKRRQLVHQIAEKIDEHVHLAETSAEQLLAETKAQLEAFQPGLAWEAGGGPRVFAKLMERKAAIADRGKGPITVGYVVYLARQKSRRPTLTLGKDWKATLAERFTVDQLTQIRDTLVNRISAVEGLGSPHTRNKKQSSPRAVRARSPKELDDRRW